MNYDDAKFYEKMGFKSGLEIHQQLNTKKKLFCNCPTGIQHIDPDARIVRHMRPTLSEMGTYDGTALMEFKTHKEVQYLLYRDFVCTYEMDDTPPFPINQEALDFAIEIALMLNCQLVDEVHITRKQYLDGSIPTGFQRTAIIGVNGWVPYRGRKIRIQQLALEEDSCREVSDNGHTITFKTDRLSTPLIEIVTLPDMLTPFECAEVDELLGRLLRASGLVRRGIGSVRQDVNSSVAGSTRIEIKGVPKTWYIPRMLHVEALRQQKLLEIKDKLVGWGLVPNQKLDASLREQERQKELERLRKEQVADVTKELYGSSSPLIKGAFLRGEKIWAVKLPLFHDVLSEEIEPSWGFGDEFGGRIRVIACIDKVPNLAWRSSRTLYPGDWEPVANKLGAYPTDELVLVWGPEADLKTAVNEVLLRADEAVRGIPSETRQHMQDGYRTDFERVLPGPDRMYPDTDSPPVRLFPERIEKIRASMAQRPWEREEKYSKLGIHKSVAWKLAINSRAKLFDQLVEAGTNPVLAAELLVNWLKHFRRDKLPTHKLSNDTLLEMMVEAKRKNSPKEAVKAEVRSTLMNAGYKWKFVDAEKPENVDFVARDVIKHSETLSFSSKDAQFRWCCGQVMRALYGRVDGKTVNELIRKLMCV
jgi:glutamyl-tRNA(Gln) amidotransferase subunit E